jgi:cysteine-rich repeat protein
MMRWSTHFGKHGRPQTGRPRAASGWTGRLLGLLVLPVLGVLVGCSYDFSLYASLDGTVDSAIDSSVGSCGDGTVDSGEDCDDGNTTDGDGCSSTCALETLLIAAGATWRYDDTGTDLGTAWRESAHDDSDWAQGPAELGYGDADEATVLDYGLNDTDKYPTYYFRHEFTVYDPAAFESLTLHVIRDDGCVVYLNGTEVARSNMPAGTISYSTFASITVANTAESTWMEFTVASSLLSAGANVIAVEVHQDRPESSDTSFNLRLEGTLLP